MIRNPNDIQDGAKKIRMLIAGYPGIGKSTLALSAPRPLHIDCDFGIDRIEPRYRMSTSMVAALLPMLIIWPSGRMQHGSAVSVRSGRRASHGSGKCRTA